jgi:hypothetical protein
MSNDWHGGLAFAVSQFLLHSWHGYRLSQSAPPMLFMMPGHLAMMACRTLELD